MTALNPKNKAKPARMFRYVVKWGASKACGHGVFHKTEASAQKYAAWLRGSGSPDVTVEKFELRKVG